MFEIILGLDILNLTYTAITGIVASYGYYGVLALTFLDATSFPLPTEVLLVAIGYFAAIGTLNIWVAFLVALLGNMGGIMLDYYLAYVLEKDVVYKHMGLFHIKKEQMRAFDAWFAKNGAFAVFITRLLPLARNLVNFAAGFALMPVKTFIFYSILGTAMWNAVLIAFGYYAIGLGNIYLITAAFVAFAVVLYAICKLLMKKIKLDL